MDNLVCDLENTESPLGAIYKTYYANIDSRRRGRGASEVIRRLRAPELAPSNGALRVRWAALPPPFPASKITAEEAFQVGTYDIANLLSNNALANIRPAAN
jgi:hypothetical protein